jgi:hypothetical protein
MPWLEVTVIDQREEFAKLALAPPSAGTKPCNTSAGSIGTSSQPKRSMTMAVREHTYLRE